MNYFLFSNNLVINLQVTHNYLFIWHEFQVLNRIGLDCPELEALCIKDQALTNESQLIAHKSEILKLIFYMLQSVFPNACSDCDRC